MTDIENHMVVNLDAELDRLYVEGFRCGTIVQLEDGVNDLLNGGHIEVSDGWGATGRIGFDDVLQRTYEHTADPRHAELHDYADCVKEILSLYPDSKLAKLVRHMAVVTAADALDIDI